jgi:hypothetical protein
VIAAPELPTEICRECFVFTRENVLDSRGLYEKKLQGLRRSNTEQRVLPILLWMRSEKGEELVGATVAKVSRRSMRCCGSYEIIDRNMHMGLDTWDKGATEEPRMSITSMILLKRALDASSKLLTTRLTGVVRASKLYCQPFWLFATCFLLIDRP